MRISDWSSDVCSSDLLTVAGDGSNLVSTDVLAGEFIDALRPASVTARLGARVISGLRGDIALPKRDARTPTADWYAEGDDIRSEDRRVGKGCGGKCRFRGSAYL